MSTRDEGEGAVYFDAVRNKWRVVVMVNGYRHFRRVDTELAGYELLEALKSHRLGPLRERHDILSSTIDVRGLSREQIELLLMMIKSWGFEDQ